MLCCTNEIQPGDFKPTADVSRTWVETGLIVCKQDMHRNSPHFLNTINHGSPEMNHSIPQFLHLR